MGIVKFCIGGLIAYGITKKILEVVRNIVGL